MRLFLKEIKDLKETEVEIRYRERDEEVENLISAVNSAHDKLIGVKDNGDCVPVSFTKILYFEAVDRRHVQCEKLRAHLQVNDRKLKRRQKDLPG